MKTPEEQTREERYANQGLNQGSDTQAVRGLNNDHIDPKHRQTPGDALGNQAAWHCPRCQEVWYRMFEDEICQGCGEEPERVLWDGRSKVTPIVVSTEAPMRDVIGPSKSPYPAEMLLSCDHIVRLTKEMLEQYQRKEFDQIGCVMCWRIERASKDDGNRISGAINAV